MNKKKSIRWWCFLRIANKTQAYDELWRKSSEPDTDHMENVSIGQKCGALQVNIINEHISNICISKATFRLIVYNWFVQLFLFSEFAILFFFCQENTPIERNIFKRTHSHNLDQI